MANIRKGLALTAAGVAIAAFATAISRRRQAPRISRRRAPKRPRRRLKTRRLPRRPSTAKYPTPPYVELAATQPTCGVPFSAARRQTRVMTISSDKTARIWNVATGRPRSRSPVTTKPFAQHPSVRTERSWRPRAGTGKAKTWNAVNGALIADLEGHPEMIESIQFSPDGSKIVTASRDSTARVWNAKTGTLIAALTGHGEWAVGRRIQVPTARGSSRRRAIRRQGLGRRHRKTAADSRGARRPGDQPIFSPDGTGDCNIVVG